MILDVCENVFFLGLFVWADPLNLFTADGALSLIPVAVQCLQWTHPGSRSEVSAIILGSPWKFISMELIFVLMFSR